MRLLGTSNGPPLAAALNFMVESESAPDEPIALSIADEACGIGRLIFDGAEVLSRKWRWFEGVLAFAVHQVNDILDRRGAPHTLEIVDWKSIDDESTEQYLGIVRFARNLERHLGADALCRRSASASATASSRTAPAWASPDAGARSSGPTGSTPPSTSADRARAARG